MAPTLRRFQLKPIASLRARCAAESIGCHQRHTETVRRTWLKTALLPVAVESISDAYFSIIEPTSRENLMSMLVGGSSTASASQSAAASNWQQNQQNTKALFSALKSNDLSGAQQAFAALTGGSSGAAANSNSPLAKIGKALQNGDLAGAQQAAQALHGRHHHHGGAEQSAVTASSATTPATSSPALGTVVNTTA